MAGDHVTTGREPAARRPVHLWEAVTGDGWAEHYLRRDQLTEPSLARPRQRFEAVARFVRDLLADRWVKTRQTRERENPKRVYYLSMEFLIGRTLTNNISNLMAEPLLQEVLKREGIDFHHLVE